MHALLWNIPIHHMHIKYSRCHSHIGSSLNQKFYAQIVHQCIVFSLWPEPINQTTCHNRGAHDNPYLALFGPLSLVLVATNSININTLLNMEFQKHTKLAFFRIAQHHKSNNSRAYGQMSKAGIHKTFTKNRNARQLYLNWT